MKLIYRTYLKAYETKLPRNITHARPRLLQIAAF